MSIEDKLTTIAENQEKVFEAGRNAGAAAERLALWNGVQENGNRTDYERAFTRWSADGIKPLYDMKPTRCPYMFYNIKSGASFDLAERLEMAGVVLDTSQSTAFNWMFYATPCIDRIPAIDTTSADSLPNVFYGTNAHTIDKVVLRNDGSQTFQETFAYASKLQNIVIEGCIGQTVSFSACPFTKDSILSAYNALSTAATGMTCTFNKAAINTAFETSEGAGDGSTSAEWQALVDGKANWTIALGK